jgi:hypothetical protein
MLQGSRNSIEAEKVAHIKEVSFRNEINLMDKKKPVVKERKSLKCNQERKNQLHVYPEPSILKIFICRLFSSGANEEPRRKSHFN